MRDKRPVDELSIEELERILAIRKREERQKRLEKMRSAGRVIEDAPPPDPPVYADALLSVDTASHGDTQLVWETPVEHNKAAPAPGKTAGKNGEADDANLRFAPPRVRQAAASKSRSAVPVFEDEPGDLLAANAARRAADKTISKRILDRALLLVEIGAVLGLVFLGYNLFRAIGVLEQETAVAVQVADEQRRATIPTIAPTPQLTLEAIVLPGGHTFSEGGAPQFNYSEIPAHLLPMVQDQLLKPVINRPPPTDETALRLIIPKLNVDQTIVQGVDWEALRLGIGQLVNGATPAADQGNVVLAAHNDIYGEYFRYLDQLVAGDQFQIQTRENIYTYTVTGWETVAPNDTHVMDPRGGATATLISCYPYQVNNKRIVVYAARGV